MVFVSLEGFLEGADIHGHYGTPATVSVPHAQRPPQAPVHVVVTPGSPTKPSATTASTSGPKRSRLRRATSAFSSLASSTAKHASPTDVAAAVDATSLAPRDSFVVYVTDRDVHHKWVLAKSPSEYTALKKALQAALAGCACRVFACCGPLRRVATSSQYKAPKRRWSDSRVATQFSHCSVVQEFLNDLLLAVLRRDTECDATQRAWAIVSAFLDVETQRSDVADKLLLRTVGTGKDAQSLRRSRSAELPTRRFSHVVDQHQSPTATDETSNDKRCHDGVDSDTDDASDASDDDVECPICCASLDADAEADAESTTATTTPTTTTAQLLCGHVFHTECVRVWLRMKHSCPVCRIPIEGMGVEASLLQ